LGNFVTKKTHYIPEEIDGEVPQWKGNMICQNEVVYAGEWKNRPCHGRGKLNLPCGTIYEGGFQNGRFHGQGTYKGPSKSHNIQLSGSFEEGKYVRTAANYTVEGLLDGLKLGTEEGIWTAFKKALS
jgi:hypothetical protein